MMYVEFTANWAKTECVIRVRGGSDGKDVMDINKCWLFSNYFVEQSLNFLGEVRRDNKEITVHYNHINDLAYVVDTCDYLVKNKEDTEKLYIITGITKDNGTLYLPTFPKEKIDKIGKPTFFAQKERNVNTR